MKSISSEVRLSFGVAAGRASRRGRFRFAEAAAGPGAWGTDKSSSCVVGPANADVETTRGELGTDLAPRILVLTGGKSFWGPGPALSGPVDRMKLAKSRTDDTSARASRGALDRIKGDFGLRGKGRSVTLEPDGDATAGGDNRSPCEVPADDVITRRPIFGSEGSGFESIG